MNLMRLLALALASATFLSGCASQPTVSQAEVTIAPDTHIPLPSPGQLGYSLTASQLLSAKWPGQTAGQQLPVQLQVDQHGLILAGFSSWGTRILSLQYQNGIIDSDVMAGLSSQLPEPQQILFNLMITLWPQSAWEGPLNTVSWRLIDEANRRLVFNETGETVIEIRYANPQRLTGEIEFFHHQLNYQISIITLDHQIGPIQP
ncbi:DUF3261 domain-containing protein [Vibrio sp.]|uniref:DUF3261 domain-containing protein n=1 Tax=Vibrio sp. TaxID=678 RepID=UPI003D0F166A